MAYVIKRRGTGLVSQAGSSFGGMTQAKKDVDEFLRSDGTWSPRLGDAHKFQMRAAAENRLATLPAVPGVGLPYEITED